MACVGRQRGLKTHCCQIVHTSPTTSTPKTRTQKKRRWKNEKKMKMKKKGNDVSDNDDIMNRIICWYLHLRKKIWRVVWAWVVMMSHRNVQPQVSINQVACYRTKRSLMGRRPTYRQKEVSAPHHCLGMCARQHTFHSRGSLLPTREDTGGEPRIPLLLLWNPRLPTIVLELTKNEVVGGSSVVTGLFYKSCKGNLQDLQASRLDSYRRNSQS